MARLILLEDEPILRNEITGYLSELGHVIDSVGTIAEFRATFSSAHHLIALVDLGLPDGDGIALIEWLRGQGTRVGIIVVSARSGIGDRVRGLGVGADHYLTKPFELEELAAVTAALTRRLGSGNVSLHWVLDVQRGCLTPPGKAPVPITAQGLVVLNAIAAGHGEFVERRSIVEALGEDYLVYDQRRLDTQIHQLRKSVLDASGVELPIRTLRNHGYQFHADIELGKRRISH